ncbi:hypothetical protein QJS10_CPB21g00067 [Acorus calamus]|uniref:Exportin-4 n=1 Tax=Acorus calamus TaxID=4465 RepID=A0AAV9C7J1_ACOCL|nr:hypothetical protein QJS10_CPB21g00067 [Acorus calamus]
MQLSEASNLYVRDLMGPMTTYLVDISNKSDLKIVAQQPDAIHMVSCLLERLRGTARATQPRTQKAIFEMAVAVMIPLLNFLEIYKNETVIIHMILKFVVDLVDAQVAFLENKETAILVNFCMKLLQIYSAQNIGKVSVSSSSSLLSQVKVEKYKDLRALLKLLTNLCSKDLVDFSHTFGEENSTDIAQVVYLGLHIVTPLISLDLLKYPKLCRDYFALMSHMLDVYPEKVVELNAEAFAHIIRTLDFGIPHQDIDVVSMCLRAVNALATYHYKEKSIGKEGLGTYAISCQGLNGEGTLRHFLQLLLQHFLFEDYSSDLISHAADALLPLILCELDLYQRLASELVERQVNPAFKSRLANALQVLTTSNEITSTLDRANYKKFRKNFHNFLIEVRGFLWTK